MRLAGEYPPGHLEHVLESALHLLRHVCKKKTGGVQGRQLPEIVLVLVVSCLQASTSVNPDHTKYWWFLDEISLGFLQIFQTLQITTTPQMNLQNHIGLNSRIPIVF
jgi:hypothetical protein